MKAKNDAVTPLEKTLQSATVAAVRCVTKAYPEIFDNEKIFTDDLEEAAEAAAGASLSAFFDPLGTEEKQSVAAQTISRTTSEILRHPRH